jgi:hypothetical protein
MTRFGRFAFTRGLAIVVIAFMLPALPGAAPLRPALAVADAPDAISPVEEFSRELERLKKNFADLVGHKIDQSAKAIDSYTDAEKTHQEIENLRAAVSAMLDAVADMAVCRSLAISRWRVPAPNSKTWSRTTVSSPKRSSISSISGGNCATTPRRQPGGLIPHAAILPSCCARCRLMRISSTSSWRCQTQKIIEVIHELTHEIRGASDALQKLTGGIKPPGA